MVIDPRLAGAVGGTVGGVLGTAFMQTGLKLSQKLPESVQPVAPVIDPGEFMVNRAELLVHHGLPDSAHQTAARGLHWAYGTAWGIGLGLVAPALGAYSLGRMLLAGAGMGALCWAAGFVGWLPAVRLTEPVHRQGAPHVLTALGNHIAFGVLAAVPVYLALRAVLPRRRRFLLAARRFRR